MKKTLEASSNSKVKAIASSPCFDGRLSWPDGSFFFNLCGCHRGKSLGQTNKRPDLERFDLPSIYGGLSNKEKKKGSSTGCPDKFGTSIRVWTQTVRLLFSVRQVSLSPNSSDLIKVARILFGHPVVSGKKEKECYSSSVAAAARKREIFYSIWQWQEPCISHLLKLHSSISSLSFLILLVLYFLVFE